MVTMLKRRSLSSITLLCRHRDSPWLFFTVAIVFAVSLTSTRFVDYVDAKNPLSSLIRGNNRGGASTATATATTQSNSNRIDYFTFLDKNAVVTTTTQIHELTKHFEPVLIKLSSSEDQQQQDDIDTLSLIKACKEFAKQTRKLGLNTIAKDMENNIRKIETLYNIVPSSVNKQSMSSLLQYERDTLQIHKPGGILKDPSAAIGFLWIRRTLHYQSEMYKNILHHKKEPKIAALDAYKDTLQDYHKFPLRKIFTASLSSALQPRKETLAKIGGIPLDEFGVDEENATIKDLNKLINIWSPLINKCKRVHIELDLEDIRRVPV